MLPCTRNLRDVVNILIRVVSEYDFWQTGVTIQDIVRLGGVFISTPMFLCVTKTGKTIISLQFLQLGLMWACLDKEKK